MSSNCYKKLFIDQIKQNLKDEDSENSVVKTIMKSRILGIIRGIQKFSRRTIYSVDDGTGTLDCVLWHNESASANRLGKCLNILSSDRNESATHDKDLNDICQLLSNKVQVNEEDAIYTHGDVISCLGNVKLVKGKVLLDINYHYKADNVNAETSWILEVLFNHQFKLM